MEGPQEVTVPDQELGVPVDVLHPHLMQADEIFVPALGRRELPGGGFVH